MIAATPPSLDWGGGGRRRGAAAVLLRFRPAGASRGAARGAARAAAAAARRRGAAARAGRPRGRRDLGERAAQAALDAEDAADGWTPPSEADADALPARVRRAGRRASASRRASSTSGTRRASRRAASRSSAPRCARRPRTASPTGRRRRAPSARPSGGGVGRGGPAPWTPSRSSRTASRSSRPSSRAAAAPSTSTGASGALPRLRRRRALRKVNDGFRGGRTRQVPRAVPLRHRLPRGVPLAAGHAIPTVGGHALPRRRAGGAGAARGPDPGPVPGGHGAHAAGADARAAEERAFHRGGLRQVGIDAGSTTVGRPREGRAGARAATRSTAAWSTRRATGPPRRTRSRGGGAGRAGRRRRLTAGAGGVDGDCRPVSRDAWDAGSLFLADHRLVHAGRARSRDRVVLFTTFTVQSTEAEAATYDPRPVHALLPR